MRGQSALVYEQYESPRRRDKHKTHHQSAPPAHDRCHLQKVIRCGSSEPRRVAMRNRRLPSNCGLSQLGEPGRFRFPTGYALQRDRAKHLRCDCLRSGISGTPRNRRRSAKIAAKALTIDACTEHCRASKGSNRQGSKTHNCLRLSRPRYSVGRVARTWRRRHERQGHDDGNHEHERHE